MVSQNTIACAFLYYRKLLSYDIKTLRRDAQLAVRNILLTQSARALAFRERNAFLLIREFHDI